MSWPWSLSATLWWALLVCVVLFLVLVVTTLRYQGSRTVVPQVLVNAVALVTVGLAVVVGVRTSYEAPDPGACKPPGEIADAAERALAERSEQRPAERASLASAREDLQAARAPDRADSSAATARDVREARRTVSRATARLRAWRPATATIADTTPTAFDLGNDRNPGVRSIAFTLDGRVPGPELVAVTPTPFVGEDSGPDIAPSDLRSWAVLDPDGRSGTLFVCVSTHSRPDLPSGRRTGALVADDVRLARFAPEVTLTLAYPDVTRVMLVGLSIAFAASWYVFFLRRDQLSDVVLLGAVHTPAGGDAEAATDQALEEAARVLRWPFGFWVGYWRWVTSASGVITIVAGMAAAVTAFSTAYLSSETWTGSFGDWFAYCGAVATAFVAGGTAGKLAQIAAPGDEAGDAVADAWRRRRDRRRRDQAGQRPVGGS